MPPTCLGISCLDWGFKRDEGGLSIVVTILQEYKAHSLKQETIMSEKYFLTFERKYDEISNGFH